MKIRKFKTGIIQLMALFITTCSLLSCQSQQEIKPTEPEMVVGIDPDFIPEPDPTDNGRVTAAAETVILNKARLWLCRGDEARGTFKIRITRVSDGHVMITSKKVNASDLNFVYNEDNSLNPGRVIFDLSERTIKLKAGTKYKIEVECSYVSVDAFKDAVLWARYTIYQGGDPYTPGRPTIRLIFADGTEKIKTPDLDTDFKFETEVRRSDGTTYVDQRQKTVNNLTSISGLFFDEGEKKNALGQEFVPSVQ